MLGSNECDNPSYELDYFDDLITERLNPDANSDSTPATFYIQCQAEVIEEKKRLIKKIICATMTFNDEDKARCFIRNRESRICFLADEVSRYLLLAEKNTNPLSYRLLCQVEQCLVSVMLFISQQFPKYFDFLQKAPKAIKENSVNQFHKRFNGLSETVNGQGNRLFQIVDKTFLELFKAKETSFYTLNYFTRFVAILESIDYTQSNWVEVLKMELIDQNFNTALFTEYLTNEILSQMELEESSGQKRHFLLMYLKQYNRMEQRENPYNPRLEPICMQVTSWITEELELLEQNTTKEATFFAGKEGMLKKIKLTLSVPQLALFTRLQIEEGIINNEKMSTFRGVASMFSTPCTRDISFRSLKKQYYTFDTGTKEAVRSKLIDMLNRLNHGL